MDQDEPMDGPVYVEQVSEDDDDEVMGEDPGDGGGEAGVPPPQQQAAQPPAAEAANESNNKPKKDKKKRGNRLSDQVNMENEPPLEGYDRYVRLVRQFFKSIQSLLCSIAVGHDRVKSVEEKIYKRIKTTRTDAFSFRSLIQQPPPPCILHFLVYFSLLHMCAREHTN